MRKLSSFVGAAAALITVSFLGAPEATAAACGTTTLDNWLGGGFSCTVGNLTFSNFSYQQDGFPVPAGNVGVGPDTLFPGENGLQFNALWNNPTTTNRDAFLSFDVAGPINTFELALDGVVGSVLDVATLTLAGGTALTLSSSDNNNHVITFPTVNFLHVQDDIGVFPGGTVSSVHKAFSVPGPIVGAGLPGLVAACGGLIGLARRRRRQFA